MANQGSKKLAEEKPRRRKQFSSTIACVRAR
jgi:hypothetical protein